jgi:hypothetical protein
MPAARAARRPGAERGSERTSRSGAGGGERLRVGALRRSPSRPHALRARGRQTIRRRRRGAHPVRPPHRGTRRAAPLRPEASRTRRRCRPPCAGGPATCARDGRGSEGGGTCVRERRWGIGRKGRGARGLARRRRGDLTPVVAAGQSPGPRRRRRRAAGTAARARGPTSSSRGTTRHRASCERAR